jgi:hypothetical protein
VERNGKGRFDVRCVQAPVESKILGDFTDEVNVDLDPADADRTYGDGFHYQRRLRIHRDAQTLKIAFRDHVTGRSGSLRVEMPPRTKAESGGR